MATGAYPTNDACIEQGKVTKGDPMHEHWATCLGSCQTGYTIGISRVKSRIKKRDNRENNLQHMMPDQADLQKHQNTALREDLAKDSI